MSPDVASALRGRPAGLTVSRRALAGLAVALAVLTSTIVFSEPAPTDALMMGAIVAVPFLGVARFGPVALVNMGLWLALVALGLLAAVFSTTLGTAVKHQLVTLFLAAGSFTLAGYIAADPVPRSRLILICYVAAAMLATVAAFVGYFRLLPGAFELFTNYGRARGSFKDPNVYGAAVAPAIVACTWVILRGTPRHALVAGAVALPLVLGIFISFSRGAWFSLVLSLAMLGAIALLSTRRKRDVRRFGVFAALGSGAVVVALLGIMQFEQVRNLMEHRASLDQSYDSGPEGRFGGQAKARRLVLDNPLGIGTHTFRDTYHREEPHNVYLSMFLNAGWLGGLIYMITVTATLAVGVRDSLRPSALQGPMLILTASFAGLAFEGYVIDSDHWRSFFILMGCIWGLADAAPVTADQSRRADDPQT